jgi:hypothetical protein
MLLNTKLRANVVQLQKARAGMHTTTGSNLCAHAKAPFADANGRGRGVRARGAGAGAHAGRRSQVRA